MDLRRSLSLVALLAGALVFSSVLVGCGGSSEETDSGDASTSASSVAGAYDLDKDAMRATMEAELARQAEESGDDGMAQMAAQAMLAMLESMETSLTLNADGTASMMVTAMGESDTLSGTWTQNGSSMTLTLETEGEEPQTANGTIDGDVIRIQPTAADENDPTSEMVFRKRAAG